MIDMRRIEDFGKVAAEDDAVLDFFLDTETVQQIAAGRTSLVVGRKGAGKTALVRYFSEGKPKGLVSRALRMEKYPWGVHARRADAGAAGADAYVASWEFLMAVEYAALVSRNVQEEDEELVRIRKFLKDNYGSADAEPSTILQPESIKVSGTLEPTILGVKLGKIDFKRPEGDTRLGAELTATSDALFKLGQAAASRYWRQPLIMLHVDDLDHGMTSLDQQRSDMLIGVVLAARNVARRFSNVTEARLCPTVYLRSDIWDALRFSDKNKIVQTYTHEISWNSASLLKLIEIRASKRLKQPVQFRDLDDGSVLRRNESKWSHVVSRTSLRPRDAIQFMNFALAALKKRPNGPYVLTNDDIRLAREDYSIYHKRELDDEIPPHWPEWEVAMQAIASNQKLNFSIADFTSEFAKRSADVTAATALERLFDYSVIGYKRPKSGGGSRWIFRHQEPNASWDPGASFFKVHPGLKEYYKLKEERTSKVGTLAASRIRSDDDAGPDDSEGEDVEGDDDGG